MGLPAAIAAEVAADRETVEAIAKLLKRFDATATVSMYGERAYQRLMLLGGQSLTLDIDPDQGTAFEEVSLEIGGKRSGRAGGIRLQAAYSRPATEDEVAEYLFKLAEQEAKQSQKAVA